MKTNQPQFKMRKPMALTLDIIDSQTPKGSHSKPQIPEIDTFEEFCSNIPDNYQQEINFSKQSQSFDSKQPITNRNETLGSEIKQSTQNDPEGSQTQIQYMVFEEFHPQSAVFSESIPSQADKLPIDSPTQDLMMEPPAPQNKNNTKFSFPQKGGGLSGCNQELQQQLVKKQLQVAVPIVEQNNTSSYEQTMIKQQFQQLQHQNGHELELKQKVNELQREIEIQRDDFCQQIHELTNQSNQFKLLLEQEQSHNQQLKQENQALHLRLNSHEQIQYNNLDKNQSECMSICYPYKMSDADKIAYLIEKMHQKSTANAKLQYEILKLQNHIEILTTKQFMQAQNLVSDSDHLSDTHSPLQFGFSQTRASKSYKEQKVSSQQQNMQQQKQGFLNLSANQVQLDVKKIINLYLQIQFQRSQMVSPLARTTKNGNPPKNLTTHQTKNHQYKEDTFQNLKKLHTKNSTSVGELNQIKPDFINCSNILQKIMRKDSNSNQSPDKPIQATQKFKEALNSKLQNIPEKHKSYASLLFSLGDFNKPRGNDAYIRQHSPHDENQIKQKYQSALSQRLNNLAHHNSRKQSETIKSEESHKLSTEQAKYIDKQFDYQNYHRKGTKEYQIDILQLMKEIKGQKIGSKLFSVSLVSTKINYKKPHYRATITESKSSRSNKQNFD